MSIKSIDNNKNSSSTTVIDSIIDLIGIASSNRVNRTRDGGSASDKTPRYRGL